MSKFSSERQLERIISSHRAYNGEKKMFITDSNCTISSIISTGTAQLFRNTFFPIWMLLALIPEKKGEELDY